MATTYSQQDQKNMAEIAEFIQDGYDFFAESEYHYNRTYSDFSHPFASVTDNIDWIPAPGCTNMVRELIGKNGCHFIRISDETGCPFIYHDKTTNLIEIRGPSKKARNKAKKKIQGRIHRLIKNRKNRHLPYPRYNHTKPTFARVYLP